MPPTLTLSWWNETKKKASNVPTTGMTPALTKYEKALEALSKKETQGNLDPVRLALKEVETARKKALELMDEKKGFEKVYEQVNLLQNALKTAKANFIEIEKRLGLEYKQETAKNELEAEYEKNWFAYEKVRDSLAEMQDLAKYEEALQLLGRLKTLAEEITGSKDTELIGKYKKQVIVVTKIENTTRTNFHEYKEAIKEMLRARQEVLKEFETCKQSYTQARNRLNEIKSKVVTAKEEGAENDMLSLKKEAASVMKQALSLHETLSKGAYNPESTTRANLDVKKAKMSSDDSGKYIRDLSTKCFNANKDLVKEGQELQSLTKEILKL